VNEQAYSAAPCPTTADTSMARCKRGSHVVEFVGCSGYPSTDTRPNSVQMLCLGKDFAVLGTFLDAEAASCTDTDFTLFTYSLPNLPWGVSESSQLISIPGGYSAVYCSSRVANILRGGTSSYISCEIHTQTLCTGHGEAQQCQTASKCNVLQGGSSTLPSGYKWAIRFTGMQGKAFANGAAICGTLCSKLS
jgi:hypothetical protein